MSPLRWLGYLLLWGGFLWAAFTSVRSTDIESAPWATISWPLYAAAMAIAVVGVALLRSTSRRTAATAEQHADDVAELEGALQRLRGQIQSWQSPAGRPGVHDMHRQIDALLADDLSMFAERREALIDAFGLPDYARVMTEFAAAERAINRMWSASADGYVDEVDLCLIRAAAHLENAQRRLHEARSGAAAAR